MARRIHVVINPGSGQPKPILHTLNKVFNAAGYDWDISLTHKSGDAEKFIRQAAESGADVVGIFGGDGSVMEAAIGLMGLNTPLAILPGGTGNVLSVDLGIPKDLEKAATLAVSQQPVIRKVDMGKIGDKYFIMRVGLGFSAAKTEMADRDMKDRYGRMAYSIGGLKAVAKLQTAKYSLTLDGQKYEVEGVNCLVDNSGSIGLKGIKISQKISVSDGLLDVLLVRSGGKFKFLAAPLVKEMKPDEIYVDHWQAKDIHIETDPPQPIQVDGEIVEPQSIDIHVVPGAVSVIVPK